MPLAGAAIELQCAPSNSFILCEKFENNSLYCFIPTGIKTGLNVHVNGCFRLTEDRKHLLCNSSTMKATSQDLKEQWNELILVPLVKALFSSSMSTTLTTSCLFRNCGRSIKPTPISNDSKPYSTS